MKCLLISTVALTLTVLFLPTARLYADAAALPVNVAPTDPNLHFEGRFDFSTPGGPTAQWSACSVGLKFKGTDINVRLKDAQNRWQIEVDGTPTTAITVQDGEHLYSVAAGLPSGEHTVRLVKATEADCGMGQFLGFQLNQGATVEPFPSAAHKFEVIGDSISCGYGNEGHNQDEHFTPATENAYFTYGAIAARNVGAEYTCIAWSGRKMWPDNTIPEIYDRILPFDPSSKWDFSKWTPDAVLINLATNDFFHGNPDEAGWTQAYEAFIAHLRTHYPNARIYLAIGPMMGDWEAGKPLTTLRGYLAKIVSDRASAGDQNIAVIDFGTQDLKNGLGADWHPNLVTHKLMGDKLTETLKKDMKW